MALIICPECGKQFSDKAQACPTCGCPNTTKNSELPVKSGTTAPVVTNEPPKNEVIKHLKYAKELEGTLYAYKGAYNKLQKQINSLGHERHIPAPKAPRGFELGGWIVAWLVLSIISMAFISLYFGTFLRDILYIVLVLPIFMVEQLRSRIVYAVVLGGIITIGLAIILYTIREVDYIKACKEHRRKLDVDAKRVDREIEAKKQLRQQQSIIQQQIEDNETLLTMLYNLNIIHPKYRNMVAVYTISEYLETGICHCLKGHEGAYARYEYDEKLGTIIGQLDHVISLLDEIRGTQYMLYEAIQEGNAIAEQISRQSERVLESNGKIAENAALTAYNTDIIRRNTTISTYIDVFSKV